MWCDAIWFDVMWSGCWRGAVQEHQCRWEHQEALSHHGRGWRHGRIGQRRHPRTHQGILSNLILSYLYVVSSSSCNPLSVSLSVSLSHTHAHTHTHTHTHTLPLYCPLRSSSAHTSSYYFTLTFSLLTSFATHFNYRFDTLDGTRILNFWISSYLNVAPSPLFRL